MKLYPIHILTKDFSLFMIFVSTTKIDWLNNSPVYSGQLSWVDAVISSIYFTLPLTIIDLILQTSIYFGLRERFKIFEQGNKFMIGALLHILTLLFYWRGMNLSDFWTGNIIAMTLSTIISGTVYYLLNKGKENRTKAEAV
jgi:hypothetical protein